MEVLLNKLIAILTSLTVVACGSSEVKVKQGGGAAAPTKVTVNIQEKVFNPSKPIVVKQDVNTQVSTVVIVNDNDEDHSIVADDGSFNTGVIRPGESTTIVVSEPGEYPYSCGTHDGERGVLQVEAAEPASPPSPDPSPEIIEEPVEEPVEEPTEEPIEEPVEEPIE